MAHSDRKTAKLRGSRTHGYGNAQKHRGAGSRGGRGMSGAKKQKWSWVSKIPDYFGRKGFKRPKSQVDSDIVFNVGFIGKNIESLVNAGIAQKNGDKYSIDLTKSECTKLCGSGRIMFAADIKVDKTSARAIEKIEAAGGSVEVLGVKDEGGLSEDVVESG